MVTKRFSDKDFPMVGQKVSFQPIGRMKFCKEYLELGRTGVVVQLPHEYSKEVNQHVIGVIFEGNIDYDLISPEYLVSVEQPEEEKVEKQTFSESITELIKSCKSASELLARITT